MENRMDKISPEDIEDLLDLLPPRKVSVKRVALNVQDNYIKAKSLHLRFKDFLEKKTRVKMTADEENFINDSYNNSNAISVKAPWTETPKARELSDTATRSACSLGLRSYSYSPDSNNNIFSNNNNNNNNNNNEEYLEFGDNKGSNNNSNKIFKEKNELDDYMNTLGSSDDDTNAYSYNKFVTDAKKPPVPPVSYWPSKKIRLTTMTWVEKVKRPKFTKKSPVWL